MICYKRENWYNPLRVAPDNDLSASRYIHAFYVFDKTGIILKHEQGWFSEKRGFEIEGLACVKKIKIDFNCKTAFLISYQGSFEEKTYDVYIPAFALGLKKPVYKKEKDFITKTTNTNIDGVFFEEHKYLDNGLWNIWGKMEKCIEKLSHYTLNYELPTFDKNLKELKKLRKEWDKALAYKENYTIEMAIEEGF